MKPLVIYHGNCADGFSAAWCFWRKYGDGADYVAGMYQQNPPDVTGRDVYLVDFSYKAPVVERLLEQASSVTLIDHHKTAIDDLRPLKEQMVATNNNGRGDTFGWFCDLNRSGATLAWDYLFPDEDKPLLLRHVEDRDLWRFTLPGTREIQAFVFAHEYSFHTWDRLMRADEAELQKMMQAGAAIERKHHKDIRELLCVTAREMIIGGYRVPAANLPYTMSSDAGHQLAIGHPFAACYWDSPEGRVFSLRSNGNGVDVSEVAKLYGGGGHRNAAGFRLSFAQAQALELPASVRSMPGSQHADPVTPERLLLRLEALLPELAYSRQTHVEWRDCDQVHRDRNPEIGSAEIHAQYVRDYDERIGAIQEAIEFLRGLGTQQGAG